MLTSSSNRINESSQVRQRNLRPSQDGQLDLTQVLANVIANWDEEMEQQMPWAQAPRAEREPVRQQVVQNNRPLSQEEKKREPESVTAIAESEESVLPGSKLKVVPEVKEEQRSKSKEATQVPQEKTEATQAIAWRAPELPKVDGAPVPPSFAVPNHSAGASGFGNTWSHAAKASQNQAENVVHSE